MTHTQEEWAAREIEKLKVRDAEITKMAQQRNDLLTAMHNAQKAFAKGKTIVELMVIIDQAIIEAEK